MDLRSTLLSSKLRVAATVLVGLAVVVGGLFVAGVVGVPGVAGVENTFADVNESQTVVETELVVDNPNPIGVTLGGLEVDYGVDMNALRMAGGSRQGVSVGAGNSTLAFRTLLDNERIPDWWISHVQNGEHTTLEVNTTVCSEMVGRCVGTTPVERSIDTDILGSFNSTESRPVNAGAPVISDPVAYVNRTSARWGIVSEAETPIRASFTVYNPKTVPLAVSTLGYDVTMNDVAVGEGEIDRNYAIPPGEAREIETTIRLDNDHLDEWWVTHLERNQVTDLRIDFYARVDLGTESARVPLRGVTHEETIRTDFFGNKNNTRSVGTPPGDTTTTPDGTTAGTTTDDGLLDGTTDDGLLDGTTTDDGVLDGTTSDGLLGDENGTTAVDDGATTTTDDFGGTTTDSTTTDNTTTDGETTTDDEGLIGSLLPPVPFAGA